MKTTTLWVLGVLLALGCSKPMPPTAGVTADQVAVLADDGDAQAVAPIDAEDSEAVKGLDVVEAVSDTSPAFDGDGDAALPDAAGDSGNQDLAQDASLTQPCPLEPLPAPAPVPGTECSKIGQRRCTETAWTYKPSLGPSSQYMMLCHRPKIAECMAVTPTKGIWQELDCQAEVQSKGGPAWKTCNTGWSFCRESAAAGAHCVPWGLNDAGIAPAQKFVPMALCPTHALGQTGCWGNGAMMQCQQLLNGKFTGGKEIQWPMSAPTYECLPFGEGGTFWVPVQYCGGGVGECPGQDLLYGKCKLQTDGLYRCDKDVWEAGCKAGGK